MILALVISLNIKGLNLHMGNPGLYKYVQDPDGMYYVGAKVGLWANSDFTGPPLFVKYVNDNGFAFFTDAECLAVGGTVHLLIDVDDDGVYEMADTDIIYSGGVLEVINVWPEPEPKI